MIRSIVLLGLAILCTDRTSWCQPPGEKQVRDLLEQARLEEIRQSRGDGWVRLLIQADAEAAKLTLRQPGSCCGIRCVQVPPYPTLHYVWNGINQVEEYQHDLLKLIVRSREGTPLGADALVVLLRSPEWTLNDNEWVPLFKTVIEIVASRRWRALKDPRLTRIEGEAYETWWSLSRAQPTDPGLVDKGVTPVDFSEGAGQARLKAIAAYEKVLAAENDPGLRRRVLELRARHDTNQRAWYRIGD
jgi:hypothetical protein